MKKKQILGMILAMTSLAASTAFNMPTASAAAGAQIYVSPKGNDEEDGSIDFPVRSIDGVKQRIIKIKEENGGSMPNGGVEVIFREGKYSLGTDGQEFGSAFSGSEGKPLVIKAYDGEKVSFTGDTKIDNSLFEHVTDPKILERLPEEARDKIYCASTEDIGISESELGECIKYIYGKPVKPTVDFYFNNDTLDMARWPNSNEDDKGYIKYGDIIEDKTADTENPYFSFEFDNERAKRWETADQMHIVGYFGNGYTAPGLEATAKDNVITGYTKTNDTANWAGYRDGRKFYAYNLLEELDYPGEYFLDRKTQMLYIYPQSAIELADISYSVTRKPLLRFNEVSYVTMNGITIENCVNNAVELTKVDHITITNCTLRNIGGEGMESGWQNKFNNVTIADNEFYNIGGNVLMFFDSDKTTENRKNLTSCNNVIKNNHFHNWSLYGKTYVMAVSMWDYGYEITNNVFNASTHALTNIGGTSGANFAYNEAYDLCEECDDAGMVYMGRSWLSRGIKIDNNYFHHLSSKTGGVSCVYLDDKFSGTTVTNNYFYKVDRGIGFSGGRDNTATNNILIDKTKKAKLFISQEARLGGFEWNVEAIKNSLEKEAALWKNNPVWQKAYPELYAAFNADGTENELTWYPKCTITNNLSVRGKGYDIDPAAEKTGSVIKNNYETGDLIDFADYENQDFSFTEEAVADFPGVKPIDFYAIGIQPSENNSQTFVERIIDGCVVLNIDNPKSIVDNAVKPIDANDANVKPVVVEGRTLVPLRFIAESFGAEVDWDGESKTAIIKTKNGTIKMPLDSKEYTINDNKYTLDVPAQVINDRTMVPVRVISESLGKTVYWDSNKKLVIVGDTHIKSLNEEYDKYRMKLISEKLK